MFRFPQPLKRIPRVVSDESVESNSASASQDASQGVDFLSFWQSESFVNNKGLDNEHNQISEPTEYRSNSKLAKHVTEPGPNDVLCGRGSAANNHIGNRRFRDFVKRFEDKYHNSCKADKSFIALQIVLHIQTQTSPPGRFLMKLPTSKAGTGKEVWYEIDALKASKKVSQRLREKKIASAMKEHKSKNTSIVEDSYSTSSSGTNRTGTGVDKISHLSPDMAENERKVPTLVVDEESSVVDAELEQSETFLFGDVSQGREIPTHSLCRDAALSVELKDVYDVPSAADLIEDVFGDW